MRRTDADSSAAETRNEGEEKRGEKRRVGFPLSWHHNHGMGSSKTSLLALLVGSVAVAATVAYVVRTRQKQKIKARQGKYCQPKRKMKNKGVGWGAQMLTILGGRGPA